MGLLSEFREEASRPGGSGGLWIPAPLDGRQQRPTLYGRPVPVFTSELCGRIPDAWRLANVGPDGPKGRGGMTGLARNLELSGTGAVAGPHRVGLRQRQ